jgi:hypothetical protein
MKCIKFKNNQPNYYIISQLLSDNPDAEIYKYSKMPNEELLTKYSVYPLIIEIPPNLGEDEVAEESTPEFRGGEWHQNWTVRKLTEQEVEKI